MLALNVMESRLKGFMNDRLCEQVAHVPRTTQDVVSASSQTDLSGNLSQTLSTVRDVPVVEVLSLDSNVLVEESDGESEPRASDSDSYSADLSDNEDQDDCLDEARAGGLVFTNTLLRLRRDHDFARFHLRRTTPTTPSVCQSASPIPTLPCERRARSSVQCEETSSVSMPTSGESVSHPAIQCTRNRRTTSSVSMPRNRRVQFDVPRENIQRELTDVQRRLMEMANPDGSFSVSPHGRLRWVRVAGLSNHTDAEGLRTHVWRMTGYENASCVSLHRRSVNPRSLPWVSYRIGVPEEFFHAVMDKSIWPSRASVREFIMEEDFHETRR